MVVVVLHVVGTSLQPLDFSLVQEEGPKPKGKPKGKPKPKPKSKPDQEGRDDDDEEEDLEEADEVMINEKLMSDGGESPKTPEWLNSEGEVTPPPSDEEEWKRENLPQPKTKAQPKPKGQPKGEPKPKGQPKSKGQPKGKPKPKPKSKGKNDGDSEAAEEIAKKLRGRPKGGKPPTEGAGAS